MVIPRRTLNIAYMSCVCGERSMTFVHLELPLNEIAALSGQERWSWAAPISKLRPIQMAVGAWKRSSHLNHSSIIRTLRMAVMSWFQGKNLFFIRSEAGEALLGGEYARCIHPIGSVASLRLVWYVKQTNNQKTKLKFREKIVNKIHGRTKKIESLFLALTQLDLCISRK